MWQFRANVSALPTARAKCHRAAQLSVAPQAARSRWSCRQPRLRPRRHAPRKHHHNTCHRAFAHADTRRAPRWAEYCAPPRPHPPARAKENSTHRRTANIAPQRLRPRRHAPSTSPGCRLRASMPPPPTARQKTSHVAGLQTSPGLAPSPTPTRVQENFATRPRASCPRRRASKRTPHRDAGLRISRPRRQSARKMPRKSPLGLPHQRRVRTFNGRLARR